MPSVSSVSSVSVSVSLLTLTLLLLLLPNPAFSLGECYFPGSPASYAANYYPCDRFAVTSVCCMTGWTCFANKLCIATDAAALNGGVVLGTVMRGTCTNPAWNETACGGFCLDDPVLENNGSMTQCSATKYCCSPAAEAGSCNCGSGSGTLDIETATAVTIIGVADLIYTSIPPLSSPSSALTTNSVSSSHSSTTKSSKSTTSPTSSSSSSPSSSSTSSHHLSTPAKAGIGIGVPLGALALFASIFYVIYRCYQRRHQHQFPNRDSESDFEGGNDNNGEMRQEGRGGLGPVGPVGPMPHPYENTGPVGAGAGSGGFVPWRPQALRTGNAGPQADRNRSVGAAGSGAGINPYENRIVYEGT